MKRSNYRILLTVFFLFIFYFTQAQKGKVTFSAGSIKGKTINGVSYRILNSIPGKRVTFTQDGTTVYCNYAKQNVKTEDFDGSGNVIVKTEDNVKIYGDKINYSKSRGNVIITGKEVKMLKDSTTLITDRLYYNFNNKLAIYTNGGTIYSKETILKSQRGYLNNTAQTLGFKLKVFLRDTASNLEIEADTLFFDITKNTAFFPQGAKVVDAKGVLFADNGEYNTDTGFAKFFGNAELKNEDYNLTCDEIQTQKSWGYSIAKGKAKLLSKKDGVTIMAEEMQYSSEGKNTKAYGKPIMTKPLGEKDMFYLSADTLLSQSDKVDTTKLTLFAYPEVRLFSAQMRGKCDSLVYQYNDSLINFYKDPVLWGSESQLTGKKIQATLKNGGMEKLTLTDDAFIISQDSLKNYNQIKGKEIISYFDDGALKKVDVTGNGQTIYFPISKTGALEGVNKITCGKIKMTFLEKNKLEKMEFEGNPDSKFIPPHQIEEEEAKLPGFRLRFGEQPNLFQMQMRKRRYF